MSVVDSAFIDNMIATGEFSPGARGMSAHDAMVQWVNANAADTVRVTMRPPLAPRIGNVDIVAPGERGHVRGHVGYGTGLFSATITFCEPTCRHPWQDAPSMVHPHILSVRCAD